MYFGVKNISISYGKKEVIKGLSLEFPKGKIVTIVGQNGCGKSSLLRTFSKGVRQVDGKIIFENKDIQSFKARELAKKIAILPQIHLAPPDISVKTLVSYGRYPYMKFGKSLTKSDKAIVEKVMKETGIQHLSNQMVSTLSGGERQRVWIAMTICQEPEILVLDEPTTYLDISYQVEVLELVRKLNENSGITIIMVLHDLNLAARYSDYLYVLKKGELYSQGTPKQVINDALLKEVFRIEAHIYMDEVNDCPYFIPQNITPEGEI
jgi:iron complex transport system ATP-binding protein